VNATVDQPIPGSQLQRRLHIGFTHLVHTIELESRHNWCLFHRQHDGDAAVGWASIDLDVVEEIGLACCITRGVSSPSPRSPESARTRWGSIVCVPSTTISDI
jgi:hypothetical protein